MSVDLSALRAAVAGHGRVARVVVAEAKGSAPREAGAAMLVWAGPAGGQSGGQSGTIGGGALEWEAVARARTATGDRMDRVPLGPALGQCCGGAVTLVTELWDAARLATLDEHFVARPLPGTAGPEPLAVTRLRALARGQGALPATRIVDGWLIEPVALPSRPVWVWGAGHVGRAIAAVLAPLPDLAVTLADTSVARLPDPLPPGVVPLAAPDLAAAVARAPGDAGHLVLTYSHALDLELCHRILSRDFATLGLIGSATKAARFRARLAALGHPPERIARLACPIGEPGLGKHPQAIAVGVAAALLRPGMAMAREASGRDSA